MNHTSLNTPSSFKQSTRKADKAPTPAIYGYRAPMTMEATTAGIDCLGCGIDAATGSYLLAYKEKIFNINDMQSYAQITTLNQMSSSCIAEQDSVSYLSETTSKVGISGGYAGFAATIETSFAQTNSEENNSSLATYSQISQLYQLTLPVAKLASMMTEDFKNALYNMEVKEFYTKYGPYFTSTVVVGGSLSSSVQTASSKTFDQSSLSVNAKASYDEGISHGEVETSYTHTDSTTHTTYECNTGIVMIGGNMSYTDKGAVDVVAWGQSVVDNPAVVGWGSLTPMWELISDNPQRVSDLKGAIDAYFSEPNSYILTPLTMQTRSLSSANMEGPESVTVSLDRGYKVLCGGASLAQDSSNNQFLTNCNAIMSDTPNQWMSGAKHKHNKTHASLTSYVTGIYDPFNLLDVKIFKAKSANAAHPFAQCSVDSGYIMTGGGVTTNPSNSHGLLLTASYPLNSTTWMGMAKDHNESCPGTIDVYAIGIKWRNATDKPVLTLEITSNKSPVSNNPSQVVGAGGNCTQVGGGAFDDYGSGKGNMLQDCYPTTNANQPAWFARGHDCEDSCKCVLTVYSMGLKVKWMWADGSTTYTPFGPGCLTPPPGFDG